MVNHLKNAAKILSTLSIDLPATLLSYAVAPIALLFCSKEDDRLPKWAAWCDEKTYGINGDGEEPSPQNPAGSGWKGAEHANGRQREYLWRVRWLRRNTANTFSVDVTGRVLNGLVEYKVWGDPQTSDSNPGHNGFLYCEAHVNNEVLPCYYWIRQWGNSGKCIRLYMGWKIKNNWESVSKRIGKCVGDSIEVVEDTDAQFVFVFNPFMGFER